MDTFRSNVHKSLWSHILTRHWGILYLASTSIKWKRKTVRNKELRLDKTKIRCLKLILSKDKLAIVRTNGRFGKSPSNIPTAYGYKASLSGCSLLIHVHSRFFESDTHWIKLKTELINWGLCRTKKRMLSVSLSHKSKQQNRFCFRLRCHDNNFE